VTRPIAPEELEAACRALVSARRTNLGVEVTLPVIYPTGQAVRVVVAAESGAYVVHDASHGALCLASAGVRFTRGIEARLARMRESFGCEFVSGRVSTRCREDQLAVAIALVANASRGVGDEARSATATAARDFAAKLDGALRAVFGRRLRAQQEIVADSGKAYRVSHVLLDRAERGYVAFIEPAASPAIVPRRVAEFLDLRDEYPEVAREAVYDDGEEANWDGANLLLLQKVSNPVPFSNSAPRLRALAEAA